MTVSCIHGISWASSCALCGRGIMPDSKVTYTMPPPWTEERVKRLLDALATICQKLESIEYQTRTRR